MDYQETSLYENFMNWVHAICIVTFDLELGQAMELIYPNHQELTESERTNICYLSFPDSNSGLMGNVQFHFRIRMNSSLQINKVSSCLNVYNDMCPPSIMFDSGYLYGYVYFRQVKDKSLKRGYFQKSVVLLSRLPFISFFTQVMEIVAPEYFKTGEASIEAACHDIDRWPSPTPGNSLSLPLHGNILKVRIWNSQDRFSQVVSNSSENENSLSTTIIISSPHELAAFPILSPILPYINLLWELVLISEPIVVMASNPSVVSSMVQTIVSLIFPLRFCSDYRPFFTIHDSEFKEYTTRTSAPPRIILGVTNPFFAKTLLHWPHIIRLGECKIEETKLIKNRSFNSVEPKSGLYTKAKPHLQTDKTLMKRLLKGVQMGRPAEVQSALIRRYLLELTQSFMIPLERYVASLMPLQKNVSPFKKIPSLRVFREDDFLSKLENSGPHLTSGIKGDWATLYKKFFKSTNFSFWFNSRIEEMNKKLQSLHLESIIKVDLKSWVANRCEVEIVDMILRLRSKIRECERSDFANFDQIGDLNKQVKILFESLPNDLKLVLKKS